MTIQRFELFPLRLRFRRPFATSAGLLDRREVAVLRLTDAEGAVGLGEVTPYPHPATPTLDDLIAALERHARVVLEGACLGDAREPRSDLCADLLAGLSEALPAPALAAVDVALRDLVARRRGVPLANHLNSQARPEVEVNATIAEPDADAAAEMASDYVRAGFRTLKLKVGLGDDRRRLHAVRLAAGWQIRIRIDANGAWNADEAIESISELAQYGLELVEQPVAPDDLQGMHRVRESVSVPIVADEGVRTESDLDRHLEHAACDGVVIKLSEVGGILRASALADRADAAGLLCIVTGTLDGPLGLAAGLHFAAARPEIELACGLSTESTFERVYASGLPPVTDGSMRLGDSPGLGIELDESALHALSAT